MLGWELSSSNECRLKLSQYWFDARPIHIFLSFASYSRAVTLRSKMSIPSSILRLTTVTSALIFLLLSSMKDNFLLFNLSVKEKKWQSTHWYVSVVRFIQNQSTLKISIASTVHENFDYFPQIFFIIKSL